MCICDYVDVMQLLIGTEFRNLIVTKKVDMRVYLRAQVGSSPLHMPVVLLPFSKQVLNMSPPTMLNPGLQEYTAFVPKA